MAHAASAVALLPPTAAVQMSLLLQIFRCWQPKQDDDGPGWISVNMMPFPTNGEGVWAG